VPKCATSLRFSPSPKSISPSQAIPVPKSTSPSQGVIYNSPPSLNNTARPHPARRSPHPAPPSLEDLSLEERPLSAGAALQK
jgi:hypothetical protein